MWPTLQAQPQPLPKGGEHKQQAHPPTPPMGGEHKLPPSAALPPMGGPRGLHGGLRGHTIKGYASDGISLCYRVVCELYAVSLKR